MNNTTIFFQDYILYRIAGQHLVTAEVLELDIPHPTNEKDTQTYIRVETPVGPKLTTRSEVIGVLCPQCHPDGKIPDGTPPELFNLLRIESGKVTNLKGKLELRHFRYCEDCQYFKEAK